MMLSPEAKLGARAAIAVIIVVGICQAFHLHHGYWAVLTTMALISASWGESLQKAYARFGMTISGCILGYILFAVLGHAEWLILSCLLLSIFGLAYFFVVSYAWAMFFVGLIVASMFSYLGGWTLELLWQRTYETAIGCLVAALVTGLFLPIYSRQKFTQELPKVLASFDEILKALISVSIHYQEPSIAENTRRFNALFMNIRALSKDYSSAKYEMVVLMQSSKSMGLFLHKLEISFHYLSSLASVLRALASKPIYRYFEVELQDLWRHLQHQLNQIQLALENRPTTALDNWEDSVIRNDLRQKFFKVKQEQQFSVDEMMHLTACVYYGRMLDKTLREMACLMVQDQSKK
ncbi:MAG: FUSC family protein [Gammaproteobacteria bacterium]|nr:FUSC family protein [Gammaproteobacteria bacterium]